MHRLALIALLLQMLSLAMAVDAIRLGGAYWIDADGESGLDLALAQETAGGFTSFSRMLTRGFVAAPVWVRLDLPAGEPDGEPWVLRLRPPWHDEIQLFDPAFPSERPRLTGSVHPWSDDEYRSLNLNFRVPQGDEPRSLMLRFDSAHSIIVSAELLSVRRATSLDQRQLAWLLLYVAFLVFVLFGSLSVWLSDRDSLFGVVSLTMTSGIVYAASMFGLLRLLLGDVVTSSALNRLNDLLIIVYPIATMWFYWAFLRSYGLRSWARYGWIVVLSMGVVNIALVLSGALATAFRINASTLVFGGVWILLVLWFGLKGPSGAPSGGVNLRVVQLVATGMMLITLDGITHTLGVWGNRVTLIEGFLTHVFVVSLLLSVVLQVRTRQRRLELVRAEQRAMHEVRVREKLQRFLDMFSHEVRTPLAILSLAVEQGVSDPLLAGQARGAISDLDQLVARSLQVDALEAEVTELTFQVVDLQGLVAASAERLGLADVLVWTECADARVSVDPYFARVVITNLLENAAKYGVEGAPIAVAVTRQSPDSVALTVRNRIDARGKFDPARVFDKYYRGPYAARRSGAGLGLYLSRALAELQGGGLRLAQLNHEGVAFEWWLRA